MRGSELPLDNAVRSFAFFLRQRGWRSSIRNAAERLNFGDPWVTALLLMTENYVVESRIFSETPSLARLDDIHDGWRVVEMCHETGTLPMAHGQAPSRTIKNSERAILVRRQTLVLLLLILSPLVRHDAHAWIIHPLECPCRRHSLCMSEKENTQTSFLNYSDDNNVCSLPRLYVGPNVRLRDGMQFPLTPDQAHYVTKVMRLGKKNSRNSVRVFDGSNGEWLAQIQVDEDEVFHKKKKRRDDRLPIVAAQCTRALRPQNNEINDPLIGPWLFFAPLKKQRIKVMLEKCTELGVGRFVPILTERADPSSVRDVLQNLGKLTAQSIEASEQCERLTVPPLSETCVSDRGNEDPWNLTTLLHNWSAQDAFRYRHLLICRERAVDCSVAVLKQLENLYNDENATGVAFVIGPEGGWSPAEETLCDQYAASCSNIHFVSLGSLVLRAETAAITAISACMLCQELYRDDRT